MVTWVRGEFNFGHRDFNFPNFITVLAIVNKSGPVLHFCQFGTGFVVLSSQPSSLSPLAQLHPCSFIQTQIKSLIFSLFSIPNFHSQPSSLSLSLSPLSRSSSSPSSVTPLPLKEGSQCSGHFLWCLWCLLLVHVRGRQGQQDPKLFFISFLYLILVTLVFIVL